VDYLPQIRNAEFRYNPTALGKIGQPFHSGYDILYHFHTRTGDLLSGVPVAYFVKIPYCRIREGNRGYFSRHGFSSQSEMLFDVCQAHFPALFQIHQSLDDSLQECPLFRLRFEILQRLDDGYAPAAMGQEHRPVRLVHLTDNPARIDLQITHLNNVFGKFSH
jgi:hypothetical protein